MKNRRRIFVIWALVFIAVVTIFWFFTQREKSYLWGETYSDDGMQPYDLGLFKQVLKASKRDEFLVLQGLSSDTTYMEGSGNTMVLVDGYAIIDSTDAAKIRRFAEKGNTVFISTNTAGSILHHLGECSTDSITRKTFGEEAIVKTGGIKASISLDRYNQPTSSDWMFFNDINCGSAGSTISIEDEIHPNMINIHTGAGNIRVHCTPLVFTNYHFRRDEVYEYVSAILPDPLGEKLYYLEPSPFTFNPGNPTISESPLRFILSHPPLKWAWYLIIFTALAYVLNGLRRNRRAIPILTLPENQTKEFIDMIYRLYRKEGSHRDIVRLQDKHLRLFLRNKYGISLGDSTRVFSPELGEKLKMDPDYLERFFEDLNRFRHNSTLTDSEFLEIDRKITEFYLRCP